MEQNILGKQMANFLPSYKIKSHGFFEKVWTKVTLGGKLAARQRLGRCLYTEIVHSLTGHRWYRWAHAFVNRWGKSQNSWSNATKVLGHVFVCELKNDLEWEAEPRRQVLFMNNGKTSSLSWGRCTLRKMASPAPSDSSYFTRWTKATNQAWHFEVILHPNWKDKGNKLGWCT